ncbi:hypothetical protein SteCoe_15891 [Stentor coeruleus]|uniref:Uncharacterized protein n=1 Tax=Stentor coeruleus TaxID=5963 RepID=A0A1R2C2L7_9CILI|nr:hypothetical protein SteCoe_15891 [Stentor coeruleus]
MDFNSHDLNDFNAKLKSYNKLKRVSKHKTTSLSAKNPTQKDIQGYTVKVITKGPAVENIKEPSSKEFFTSMMLRHKRKLNKK